MTDAPARTFWMRTPAGMMIEARPDAEDDDLVPVYARKRSYDALTAEVVRLRAENQRLREALDPDNLAQIIRAVDGGNRLGAGALAEKISAVLRNMVASHDD